MLQVRLWFFPTDDQRISPTSKFSLFGIKKSLKNSHINFFLFSSVPFLLCVPVIVTSDHRVVLSQCSGVALLPHRLQEQNWIPAGPPAHRPLQFANAGG